MLLEHADAIAERLGLAATQLAEIAGAERSTLRIGAFPTALASLVPAAVAQLEGARVIVEEGASQALAERVRSGELHLAVTFQDAAEPRREPAGLERHDLLRESFLVVLGARPSRSRSRDAVDLAELAGEGWTAPSADGHHRARLPRGRLRAAPVVDHARPARDPRAGRTRARGHARAEPAGRRLPRPAAAADSRARARSATSTRCSRRAAGTRSRDAALAALAAAVEGLRAYRFRLTSNAPRMNGCTRQKYV